MIAAQLPPNYSFEVHKTIWRLREARAQTVALQLPEGLQMFACALADIIGEFAGVEVIVLGDVTYGACCVDDLTARALGADMLVHYGHSCLVPIDTCCIKTMYVFVEISIDQDHLIAAIKHNFDASKRVMLVGTVQFVGSIHKIRPVLEQHFASVTVPQSRPLSKGEILGCTAPTIDRAGAEVVIYVGDGRFHLEAIMIANPSLPYYRYDPYSKMFSAEGYAHDQLHFNRKKAIEACANASTFGVIQGTLGRQGNSNIVERVVSLLKAAGKDYITVLLSEISPQKLASFEVFVSGSQLSYHQPDNPPRDPRPTASTCPTVAVLYVHGIFRSHADILASSVRCATYMCYWLHAQRVCGAGYTRYTRNVRASTHGSRSPAPDSPSTGGTRSTDRFSRPTSSRWRSRPPNGARYIRWIIVTRKTQGHCIVI
jgi:diphthamide biosynthesis enzyme Dph1/Dph2-like protein